MSHLTKLRINIANFLHLQNCTSKLHLSNPSFPLLSSSFLWSSPRPISTSQLHALLHFHLWPIYLVVFKGS